MVGDPHFMKSGRRGAADFGEGGGRENAAEGGGRARNLRGVCSKMGEKR